MFCHNCGAKIGEGATFCHKCGTKVAYDITDSQEADTAAFKKGNHQLSVMLTSVTLTPECKIRVISLVKTLTGLGLAETKTLVENTPALLKTNVTPREAEYIKETFIEAGATVTFTDQNGNYVEITAHCEEGGKADIDDSGQGERIFVAEQTNKEASCHNCGEKVIEGTTFCQNCGAKVVYPDAEPQVSKSDLGLTMGRVSVKKRFKFITSVFIIIAVVIVVRSGVLHDAFDKRKDNNREIYNANQGLR